MPALLPTAIFTTSTLLVALAIAEFYLNAFNIRNRDLWREGDFYYWFGPPSASREDLLGAENQLWTATHGVELKYDFLAEKVIWASAVVCLLAGVVGVMGVVVGGKVYLPPFSLPLISRGGCVSLILDPSKNVTDLTTPPAPKNASYDSAPHHRRRSSSVPMLADKHRPRNRTKFRSGRLHLPYQRRIHTKSRENCFHVHAGTGRVWIAVLY